MVDWRPYLESLCATYAAWWQVYTITDVVGRTPQKRKQTSVLFDFKLMVQTVAPDRDAKGQKAEQVEKLTVLEGLRKYAPQHILLVGRPGSGKSTALVRLLLEEAEKAKEACRDVACNVWEQGERSIKIPVLVELRYYRTTIEDLIQEFLQRHDPNLTLNPDTLKTGLRQGQILLLLDGINELPSEAARRELQQFRQNYQKTTPMVFTTRDLGIGGNLGITKKLEMQPLTETQMQEFVCTYLPQQGKQMLQQLGNRLREFGQTPLLLKMLCDLFYCLETIPSNLGSVFRAFAQQYDRKVKADVPVTEDSREFWSELLQYLAFVMTKGNDSKEIQVAIAKTEAEAIFTQYLRQHDFLDPPVRARKWLNDLLKHHLIQLGANNQIEFRHQLIQEYYTAEYLLKLLPSLSDEELQQQYLNYLKWTEPLALMLGLVEDEAQAMRVVRLALAVDVQLGARLAGEVKPEFQEQTITLVNDQDVCQPVKVLLLGATRSEFAVQLLIDALKNEDASVRCYAAFALGKIQSEQAVQPLILALKDEDAAVGYHAAEALGKIQSEQAVQPLIQVLNQGDKSVRHGAAWALGAIQSEQAVQPLIRALKDEDESLRPIAATSLKEIQSDTAFTSLVDLIKNEEDSVRHYAVSALGELQLEQVINILIETLQDKDTSLRSRAIEALGEIKSDRSVQPLIDTLKDKDALVRSSAAKVLGIIQSESAVQPLIDILKDKDASVRYRAAWALGEIKSDRSVQPLMNALKDENHSVRYRAALSLGKQKSEWAIKPLINLLKNDDYWYHLFVTDSLIEIPLDKTINPLINALQDENASIRSGAAFALGRIQSDRVVKPLIHTLTDENHSVRSSAAWALGEIQSKQAVQPLIHTLKDGIPLVRHSVAFALGKIQSKQAIQPLIDALKDEDASVRSSAAKALGEIQSKQAVQSLIDSLNDEEYQVRCYVVWSLGKIPSPMAIPPLITALNDRNNGVRREAQSALEKIDIPEFLPDFSALLKTDTDPAILNIISAIQQRCKFYNYTLTQPPTTSISSDSQLTHPFPISLMHILHLSDLHFTTPDQATLWSTQLRLDLRYELNISQLDALILSGDIANYSTPEEYEAAAQFLNTLCQTFSLKPEQITIVPGNHDLNWNLAQEAYQLIDRPKYNGKLIDGNYIKVTDEVIRVRDETAYKKRFDNFRQFYETIKQKPYPSDYDQQYTLDYLPEQNLLVLGLNSAWQLDHHFKSRASIHENALSNALNEIDTNPDYDNCLKIAVWHHPLDSPYQDRITDQDFIRLLAVAGFRFFLHGHIHKAETSLFRYDMSRDGRKLDRICAGTFGAPTKELVTATPWQYNLLIFEKDKLTVRTRCRRGKDAPWESDSVWRQGAGKSSLDYYTIEL
ncbi:HEAT repeat domain-containing protein [Coleofasciculus sp. F4-SAH-05]|uniref:HEAT repeat domain-containing protein n=1 Tax=Coleofasciculus sp. F4-SAH-05 TaxID=3069525 RepID=UPI0032F3B2E6